MNNNKITARPCKERPNTWEIEDENGNVLPRHYKTKEECMEAAEEICKECGCGLKVDNKPARD